MNGFTKDSLPKADFELILEPGGIKKIKTENRRSDAMIFIAPHLLYVIPGYNVRVHDEAYAQAVRALAENMKVDGFHIGKPITVVAMKDPAGEDVLGVCAGHTRLDAVLLAISEGAPIETVPVIINGKGTSPLDMTLDLVRSNSGRPLSTYETALVIKRLANMELSEAEIARQLGLAPSYVNGLLLLAAAPYPLVKMIIAGQLAAALAIEEIRKHGHTKALEKFRKLAEAAKATGKDTRITAAALPERRYAKTLQKAAPRLHERAVLIRQDPGFAGLSSENREAIELLLAEIEQDRPEAADATP